MFVMRQEILKHRMQHRFNIEGDAAHGDLDLRHFALLLLFLFLDVGAPTLKQFERDAGAHGQKGRKKHAYDLKPLLGCHGGHAHEVCLL